MNTPLQWAIDLSAAYEMREYLRYVLNTNRLVQISWHNLAEKRDALYELAEQMGHHELDKGYEEQNEYLIDALALVNMALYSPTIDKKFLQLALEELDRFF